MIRAIDDREKPHTPLGVSGTHEEGLLLDNF